MAWLAKDADGAEFIYDEQPTRKLDHYRNECDCVELPHGGILALLGRELTFVEGGVELLETSAPITEDMVKDLMWEQTGQTHKADTPFGAYTVYLSPYTNEWHVGQLYLNFYGECDDLAHGIALCNQHHKKIILSQLK